VPVTGVAGGFRQFTNNVRPLASPDDMKGLKMRTPPIDSIIRTMNALGANPQQVPYGETYMALKTNVVDGQENPCSNIAEMKFFEVQKYFTEVNYQIHPDPFFVSLTWYDALPNDLKAVFSSAARAAMARSDDVWLASEKDYQALLTQKLQPNKITAENHKAFVAKVKPVWDHYVSASYFTRAEIDEALAQAGRVAEPPENMHMTLRLTSSTAASLPERVPAMDRVARGLARLLEDLLGYVFLVITLAVVVLVVLRYFFLTTIVGGQEFTVFCFIYTSAVGAAVLLYRGDHISIPLLVDRLPPRARRWMRRVNYLEVALLNGLVVVLSIPDPIGRRISSPVLRIRRWSF
jgi:hypothetical protein